MDGADLAINPATAKVRPSKGWNHEAHRVIEANERGVKGAGRQMEQIHHER